MTFPLSGRLPKAAVSACLLVAAGCTDLDETPFDEIPAADFGETEEQFIALIGAGYTSLYGYLGNHNSYWSLQEVSSDEMVIPTRGADWGDGGQWVRVHTHTMNPAEESVNNAWTFLYGGIATTNRLIESIEDLNPELAPPFINELRGLRALYYYSLMDLYGGVPLVTSFFNAQPNPANASRREVYDFVVSELIEIIPTLSPITDVSTYGRFNRNVARMLLAKVYLNAEVYAGESRYEESLAQIDSIINSGAYSLESDYFVNFNVDNIGSEENIFVIPYDEVFANNFNLGQMTLHYQSQNTFNSQEQPWNGYATLQEFYESYDENDARRGVPGDQQVRGNFLAGPQFAADGVTRLLDPAAEDGDPNGEELTFTPEINELQPGALRQAGARIAKFEFEQGFLQNLGNDFPIFRYADALLMKAECLLRLGERTDEATDLVNVVRARAGLEDLDGDVDLDELLAERGRELFAEGFRRQDLIRFGRWTSPWWEKSSSPEFTTVMPIPAPQLQANPNLVQNQGY